MPVSKTDLAAALHDADVLKHGLFTLRSGAKSPIYVDLRQLPSVPKSMDVVTTALAEVARTLDVEALAGAETAGIPLAAVVGHKTGLPMLYVRKEPKAYGTGSQVEGLFVRGQKVALLDDLITQGTSKMVFLDALDTAGLVSNDVLIILDRQQGGAESLQERGRTLHSLITLDDL
ncbi:MAG: orotate phosphoribosyltransferase, partial [Candidatus Poribacteria bacterium]|nr:orotate phosphoribosyltransferase [Candidatus Poribacteria bacterium]